MKAWRSLGYTWLWLEKQRNRMQCQRLVFTATLRRALLEVCWILRSLRPLRCGLGKCRGGGRVCVPGKIGWDPQPIVQIKLQLPTVDTRVNLVLFNILSVFVCYWFKSLKHHKEGFQTNKSEQIRSCLWSSANCYLIWCHLWPMRGGAAHSPCWLLSSATRTLACQTVSLQLLVNWLVTVFPGFPTWRGRPWCLGGTVVSGPPMSSSVTCLGCCFVEVFVNKTKCVFLLEFLSLFSLMLPFPFSCDCSPTMALW